MDNTWIKLYRKLLESPIWLNSTPEHKSIMVALLLMANHQPNKWEWKGVEFEVNPGQFVTSLESIRKNCGKGVSIQNIRSCLKRLKKLQFATNKATKSGRLITIINWDSYQPTKEKATKLPTKEQQRSNKGATPNKNVRREEENIYPPNFLKFWKTYPKKEGKGAALKAYQNIKEPKPTLKTIIESIELHKQQEQWQTKQFIPLPATWLNQRRWEDEFDNLNNITPIKPKTDRQIEQERKQALL